MESFRAIKCGDKKFFSQKHGEVFIHQSKKNNYEYLWTSKDKFISNLFPLDLDRFSIPDYNGHSYLVYVGDTFLKVELVE